MIVLPWTLADGAGMQAVVPNRNLGSLGSFCYGRAGIDLPVQIARSVFDEL